MKVAVIFFTAVWWIFLDTACQHFHSICSRK